MQKSSNHLEDKSSTDLARSKATLLYDAPTVEQIISILNAPDVFKTPVPKNLDIDWPALNILKDKVGYDKSAGILTITGVLSQPETDAFNNLQKQRNQSPANQLATVHPQFRFAQFAVPSGPLEAGWYKGLLEVSKLHTKQEEEMRKLFQLVLSGIFGKSQQVIDSFCNIGTSAPKRLAFIQVFLPYLRKELTKRLIIDELSNAIGLDKTITQTLAVNILKNGAIPLYDSLAAIKDVHFQNVTEGYLIPVAGGDYTFVIKDNNILLKLNEDKITFTAPVDINGEWWSDKQELRAGYLYKLAMTDTRAIQPVPLSDSKGCFLENPFNETCFNSHFRITSP